MENQSKSSRRIKTMSRHGRQKGGYTVIKLEKNERLIFAGEVALRAPDGTPLPAVPTYKTYYMKSSDFQK